MTEWVGLDARPPEPAHRLAIIEPQADTHIWRNPDAPPALQRLVLRATVEPRVEQIVWLVNGEPVAVSSPDQPFHWPMRPGQHRFQVRLPLQNAVSRQVRVVVK